MAFISNLFAHPEKLNDVRKSVEILQYQIKMVEALEHGKQRLLKSTTLHSSVLGNCLPFMQYVNKAHTASNFFSEVSNLSLNELIFAMISFEGRRLKTLIDLFKASDIKTYVEKQNINCLHRSEIFTRINYYMSQTDGNGFGDIYSRAKSSSESIIMMDEDPEPETGAEDSNAFKLLGVHREGMKNIFIEHVSNTARLMTVESRYPRDKSGDAFISFDLESDRGPVARMIEALLDGDNPVAEIPEAFGHTIATAVDRSDLRIWEKRKGRTDTTNCLKISTIYHVELRICNDGAIANILYSQLDR
ncbi:hypothetical protein PV11_03489 [Exophiala sideris]|uniref:Uncharacterized protein n=1 Tax=Exophiala sideris TaxID=1016849 RepID=A0A0D1Z318_9EURO|nr:hypothetical protein PV11_03489 [Exophiala sideris]